MPLSSVVGAQSIIRPGVCTSSTRPASPYDGQVIYETDTDRTLVWNGTGWVFLATGSTSPAITTPPSLVYIKSGSASAQTTLTISDIFSSTYLNYFMTYTNVTTSSGGNVGLQFTTGGTANTNANYQMGSWRIAYSAGSGNAGGQASNQTTFSTIITDTSTTGSHGNMYFYGPFATAQTGINSFGAGGNQTCLTAGIFNATTSFDGIRLTASQNMTGTFRFYGIADS